MLVLGSGSIFEAISESYELCSNANSFSSVVSLVETAESDSISKRCVIGSALRSPRWSESLKLMADFCPLLCLNPFPTSAASRSRLWLDGQADGMDPDLRARLDGR